MANFMGNEETLAVSLFKETHIVRLMQAARAAGLKFKSGELNKAQIIDRVLQNRQMTLATMATIERLNREAGQWQGRDTGNAGDNPFAEALAEELQAPSPVPAPAEGVPAESLAPIHAAIASLTGRVDHAVSHLGSHTRTLQTIGDVQTAQGDSVKALHAGFKYLSEEIERLQKKAPIVFNIGGIETPQVSGQHERFPELVSWLAMRKVDPETRKGPRTHVLLVGPASSGKTTAALEYAKLRGLELYAQPLTMDSFGVVGYTSPDGKRVETEFTRAWVNGGVFLWDELSMSAPEAIGTLNSALANGFIPIPGLGTVYAHPDFYCIAGDNSDTGASLKYGARSLLDGASLDRFVTIEWEIDPTIESACAGLYTDWLSAVRAIRAEIAKRDIQHVGATMRAVITGAMALSAGILSRKQILEATCKKGALREQWHYFAALPAVQTFLRGE